ncbi:MAG: type II secretion system minor pseudopilin GspK [Pseudoruegeria sp.]
MRPQHLSVRDRGVVLLNALVIVAALAAVAVWLMQKSERSVNRLWIGQEATQVQLYLDGLEVLLLSTLDQDKTAGTVDHLNEGWAQTTYNVPLDRGTAFAQVSDVQGLFNINWLTNPEDDIAQTIFRNLIREAGLSETFAARIEEFVSPDGPSAQTSYANRDLPMVARGGLVVTLEELMVVPGMTQAFYERLTPWLTALPPDSRLNVNTVPASVLQAALPNTTSEGIGTLLQSRKATPFASVGDFLNRVQNQLGPEALTNVDEARFTVVSLWFAAQLEAELPLGDSTLRHRRNILIGRPGKTRPSRIILRRAP